MCFQIINFLLQVYLHTAHVEDYGISHSYYYNDNSGLINGSALFYARYFIIRTLPNALCKRDGP